MSIFYAKASEKISQVVERNSASLQAEDKVFISIPLYISAAIVQLAGLAAVAFQMDDGNGFSYFTITMSLIGFTVSYFLRRFRISTNAIRIGAIALAIFFLIIIRTTAMLGTGSIDVRGVQEMLLVSALALTATFCAFFLVNDLAVLFTCVWSIALIGLTGTVNINRELVMCFVVFLCAAVFLLVHQSHRIDRTTPELDKPFTEKRTWLLLLRTQVLVALACGFAALLGGFLIAIPLQMVGRNMSLNAIIQRLKVPPAAVTRSVSKLHLSFDDYKNFVVGLGPVDSDSTEIMTVTGPERTYWRGRVYSNYLGHGWENPDSQSSEAIGPDRTIPSESLNHFTLLRLEHSAERRKVKRVKFKFHMNSGALSPLYHVAEPVTVNAPAIQINQRGDNTIGVPRYNGGSDYYVECDISTAKPSDLRASDTRYPGDIRRTYLRNRDNLTLRALALEAVGTARNPYDKAEAIRRFIANRCVYTLDAAQVPARRDAVEFFLNESKEGYCDLYATATTMLCRYAGLPARVATGFAPGTVADDNPNRYILHNDDRHSWTEVYYNKYGWIPLDATIDTASTTPIPSTPLKKSEKPWWVRLLATDRVPVILVLLGVVVLLFVAGNELLARRSPKGNRARATTTGNDNSALITRIYTRAERQVSRRSKISRTRAMTPGDFNRQVRKSFNVGVADALAPLVAAAEAALYSSHTLTAQDVAAAQTALQQTIAALNQVPKPKREKNAIRATP